MCGLKMGAIESAHKSECLKRTLNYQTDAGGNITLLLVNMVSRWDKEED